MFGCKNADVEIPQVRAARVVERRIERARWTVQLDLPGQGTVPIPWTTGANTEEVLDQVQEWITHDEWCDVMLTDRGLVTKYRFRSSWVSGFGVLVGQPREVRG